MKSSVVLVFFVFQLLLFSCAPVRIVKPLAKGSQAVSFSYGGPLIHLGSAAIPLPLTSLAYAKGITNRSTVFGSLHTTALLFGVFQTDIGICRQIYYNEDKKFGISVNPVLNFAIDRWKWNSKLWPEIDLNVYKSFGTKNMVYGGIANWFELNKIRPHNEVQQSFLFINPHAGYVFSTSKWSYTIEGKYLMPSINTKPNAPNYIGIHNKGAIGIYLNFSRKF